MKPVHCANRPFKAEYPDGLGAGTITFIKLVLGGKIPEFLYTPQGEFKLPTKHFDEHLKLVEKLLEKGCLRLPINSNV